MDHLVTEQTTVKHLTSGPSNTWNTGAGLPCGLTPERRPGTGNRSINWPFGDSHNCRGQQDTGLCNRPRGSVYGDRGSYFLQSPAPGAVWVRKASWRMLWWKWAEALWDPVERTQLCLTGRRWEARKTPIKSDTDIRKTEDKRIQEKGS